MGLRGWGDRLALVGGDFFARDDIIVVRVLGVGQSLGVCEHGALWWHPKLAVPALAVLKTRTGFAVVTRRWMVVDKLDVVTGRAAAFFYRGRHLGDLAVEKVSIAGGAAKVEMTSMYF